MATQANDKSKGPATEDPEKVPETDNSHVPGGIPLEELGLSTRVVTVLGNAGMETAQDILDMLAQGEAVFLDISGIGPKALAEVQQQMIVKGLLETEEEPAEIEREHRTRIQTEKKLGEAQEALAATQAEIKQQQLARSKAEQALAEAERSLIEIEKTMQAMITNTEPSLAAPGEEGAEQLHSFIVRVTTDEGGQPRRTEVVHTKSGKGERFPSLNVQRLATFIEASIRRPDIPEPSPPPAPRMETPTPQPTTPPAPPETRLSISTAKVLRPEESDGMDLVLNPDEDFVIETQFYLEGAEATSLSSQESGFRVEVYAHDVTRGAATMLTSYTGNMVEDELTYKAQMPVSGMSTGLYHLLTVVLIQAPVRMMAHYDGPTFQVLGSQPLVSPTAQREASPA